MLKINASSNFFYGSLQLWPPLASKKSPLVKTELFSENRMPQKKSSNHTYSKGAYFVLGLAAIGTFAALLFKTSQANLVPSCHEKKGNLADFTPKKQVTPKK